MNFDKELKLGVVAEQLGSSRFYVFIYEIPEDKNSGTLVLCNLRKKLKSRFKNSSKRISINSIVYISYQRGQDVGYIEKKHNEQVNCKDSVLHQALGLPFYEEQI